MRKKCLMVSAIKNYIKLCFVFNKLESPGPSNAACYIVGFVEAGFEKKIVLRISLYITM